MKKEKLSIQRFENASGTVSFRVFGYLHGERVRRNFATREEAAAEKATLEIRAHQVAAGYRPVLTTLTEAQAREAESVFARVAGKPQSLTFYVDFAVENYREPETQKKLKDGIADYVAAKKHEFEQDQLSQPQFDRIGWELDRLGRHFKGKTVAEITAPALIAFLEIGRRGMKTYNNRRAARGDHALRRLTDESPRLWTRRPGPDRGGARRLLAAGAARGESRSDGGAAVRMIFTR